MNDLVIRHLQKNELDDWNCFVDESEYGTIFHKTFWNKALFMLDPAIKLSVIGCYKQDILVAGAIFGWKKKFQSIRIVVPPYASCFYGIIIKERDSSYILKSERYRYTILNELLDFVEKEFQLISAALPPEFKDIRIFNWRKYTTRILYTYQGNISNPEKIIDNFQSDVRRQINKGKKYNYELKETLDDKHLGSIFSLLEKSYHKQKHKLQFNKKQFTNLLRNPDLTANVRAYSIWLDNKPVAALVIIVDGFTAYYWLAGSDQNYFNTGLNQLLLWLVINALSKEGITLFDFVGANTLTIANYKASFNFELIPYYHISKVTTKKLKLLLSIKEIFTISGT
ncbi:MAG: GNAT family N-acetyltransferase [Bacteroidota bacterium]|nr:GNAT family N-acetyltransferase [Bacteroidota bacterium]